MLAKQGWRLVNNENPLVTSLMKARYFPHCDFLTATLGNNPSYMWRSILAAHEFVKQGCRKRIGNGDSTMVWKVPWLPDMDNGMLTTEMPPELQNITVRSLMVPGEYRWDEDVLNDICNARDVELIKKIPLPMIDRDDKWFWSLDDKGLFTVKSCYRKIQGEHNRPHSSFWKKLWSMKVPGKVVNFLWRACCNCLPTAVALKTKMVQIDVKCSWCRMENEDDTHVLFTCSFAKSVWETTVVQDLIQVLPGDKVFDILQRIFANATTDQLVSIAVICWNIWTRRNKWVWDKINMSAFGMREGAMTCYTIGERQIRRQTRV